jgi:hypothetical protein
MELVVAVSLVRLAWRVKQYLKMAVGKTKYFTDPLAVLGMLKMESGQLNEFVGQK